MGDNKHTVPGIFSIRESREANLLLGFHNVLDVLVLNCSEVKLRDLSSLIGSLGLQQFIGPEQRTEMLSAERRVTVKLGHDVYRCNATERPK